VFFGFEIRLIVFLEIILDENIGIPRLAWYVNGVELKGS
jgi:hypothetical protein